MRDERKKQLLNLILLCGIAVLIFFGSLSVNESRKNLDRLEGLQEQDRQQQENEE